MPQRSLKQDLSAWMDANGEQNALGWPQRRDVATMVLLATPRSGSTWLCELLDSTGEIGFPQEYINGENVALFNNTVQSNNERDYLNGCCWNFATENNIFVIKTTVGDALRLEEIDFFEYFYQSSFIIIRRKNIIAQAVSMYVALTRGVFHVQSPDLLINEEERDAILDASNSSVNSAIKQWVCHILNYELTTEIQIMARDITPIRIDYESLIDEPRRAVEKIARSMPIRLKRNVPITGRTIKLAENVHYELEARFRLAEPKFLANVERIRPRLDP
ncbi:MAG: sulfotransferase domain-containing protein [Hyphomicrobiales bacterium]|nr:sulfotransferase domain-containing protein [Hyphomicrobiales bacterium]MDE2017493.1 sulfotransferase domain-containing protein [Hyphomicrobiales bacterium]